jgi:predicted RNA polymerase sigma factor
VTPTVAAQGEATGVERVFREVYGQAVATLIRVFGDITLAEDAVQEAFAVASDRWRSDGIPPNPAGWIVTTARNRAIDDLRRLARGRGSVNSCVPPQPHRRAQALKSGEGTDL